MAYRLDCSRVADYTGTENKVDYPDLTTAEGVASRISKAHNNAVVIVNTDARAAKVCGSDSLHTADGLHYPIPDHAEPLGGPVDVDPTTKPLNPDDTTTGAPKS